jgi:hypothetical protein
VRRRKKGGRRNEGKDCRKEKRKEGRTSVEATRVTPYGCVVSRPLVAHLEVMVPVDDLEEVAVVVGHRRSALFSR